MSGRIDAAARGRRGGVVLPTDDGVTAGPGGARSGAQAPAYRYTAYGMTIGSDFALPELVRAAGGAPDLVIRRATVSGTPPAMPAGRIFEYGPDGYYLAFLSVGKFRIRTPDLVEFEPADRFDESLLGFALLGPVMAIVLHLRGLLILHGSATQVGDAAAIFLGDKGAGKSTIAGALAAAGHPLLNDDVVAVDCAGPGPAAVLPGFPMVKLTETAMAAFGHHAFHLIPTELPGFDKRRARVKTNHPTGAARPRMAYVLRRGDRAAIEPLSPVEAYQALLRFSYMTRFGETVIGGQAAVTHMRQCARLAGAVQVARLVVPDALPRVADAVALIEQTFGARGRAPLPAR